MQTAEGIIKSTSGTHFTASFAVGSLYNFFGMSNVRTPEFRCQCNTATLTSLIWHRQGPSLAPSVPMIYNSAIRMDWLSLANWISPHLQERQPREAEAGRWSKKISVIGEVVAVRKFPQVNLQKKLEGRVVLLAKRCHGQKETHLIAFLHFLMPVIRGILK